MIYVHKGTITDRGTTAQESRKISPEAGKAEIIEALSQMLDDDDHSTQFAYVGIMPMADAALPAKCRACTESDDAA